MRPTNMRSTAFATAITAAALALGPGTTTADCADPAHAMRGIATRYSDALAGRPTASGELYDPTRLTAAHRSLPFGTTVRVTATRSGRSTVVRINDRGPVPRSRVIDLSRRAARELGMGGRGVLPVHLEIVAPPLKAS